MRNIPGHSLFDSSLALIEEGNYFIANRCQRYQSPLFVTRLLLRRTLCMRGEMAAQLFYDQRMFSGHDGAPRLLQKILFGVDVAPGLDGAAQPQRRQLFTQALQTEQVERLVNLAEQQWLAALQRWEGQPHVLMLPEIETLLCKAVCRWAGIQLGDDEAAERRQQLAAQLDGAGRLGWGRVAAWRARG